jgi:hypothetical protein
MKMQFLIVLVPLLLVNAASTSGETISVPLPELAGTYISYDTITAPFDLGTPITHVGEARIKLKGTFYPGLAHYWWDPPSQCFSYGDNIVSIMNDPCEYFGWWEANSEHFGTVRTFSVEPRFNWWGDGEPSWDFLLDGQADVDTRLSGVIAFSWVIIVPVTAYISEAHLIIEGSLQLSTPNGGEFLLAGSSKTITWEDFRSGTGCSGNYLLKYSTDNGQSWALVDANSISNTCSYNWVVPSINSDQCLVRIVDANDPNVSDTSDNTLYMYQCQGPVVGDLNNDCYVNFGDFAIIAQTWLIENGTDMNNLSSFVQSWCNCANPYDPTCQN